MKSSGFKMKGYTYPGTSPVRMFGSAKAKAKRASGSQKAADAMGRMQEELAKEYKSSTISSKSGAPLKGSPTKKFEIKWGEVATEAIGSAVGTGTSEGIKALTKKKEKKDRSTEAASMGGAKYGGAKIT